MAVVYLCVCVGLLCLFSVSCVMLYQLPATYKAEDCIASKLALLSKSPSSLPPIALDKAIGWAQGRLGFEFDPLQTEAIYKALGAKLSIITGGPGTGKTTILRAVVDIFRAKKVRLALTAPTGRAAQRMSEATGAYAQTLHRLLKFDPALGRFIMGEEHPLPADFVILDESSMLDTKLTAALMKALLPSTHLLLVGDIHQLPSVGPGSILKNFIESNQFQVSYLNTIFRQSQVSRIVSVAHGILQGVSKAPELVKNTKEINPHLDLQFIKADTPEQCLEYIVELCSSYIPRYYPEHDVRADVQVLAPMHKGVVGIASLNKRLQEVLNPSKVSILSGFTRFAVGDKVIQTRNNYDKNIFNGDIGYIANLDVEKACVRVQFEDELVELERLDLGDLALAYAMSIHKSQGSEFPVVIIPLLKQHFMMLQRNLVYTAITRGRKKVFLVGDPVAYAMAIRNQESTERSTNLCYKISQLLAGVGAQGMGV